MCPRAVDAQATIAVEPVPSPKPKIRPTETYRSQLRQSLVVSFNDVMADLVPEHELPWKERLVLRMIQAYYLNRLRSLLADVLPDMSAEILSACEKASEPVIGFTLN